MSQATKKGGLASPFGPNVAYLLLVTVSPMVTFCVIIPPTALTVIAMYQPSRPNREVLKMSRKIPEAKQAFLAGDTRLVCYKKMAISRQRIAKLKS